MSGDSLNRFQPFPTTQWTLVGRAGLEFDISKRDALNDLLRRYWPALKAHLISKKRIDPNEADDFVQGFIESRILERNLVGTAERGRGKFRNLLATALDNYVANEFQKRGAKKRSADRAMSLDVDTRQHLAQSTESPDYTFDLEWARQLLAEAVTRMRDECEQNVRHDLWTVFEGRLLAPIRDGAEPMAYEELVQRCGFASPSQASNALITAKRMFARVVRAVVRQYATDEQEVEEEIRELEIVLAGGS
jgi:hypothetical protein